MKTQRKERDPKMTVKKTPLTKSHMISTLQRMEAAAWLELKQAEHAQATTLWIDSLRARWATLESAMSALCIQADFQLPDNKEATAIICERIARQQEA